jgi:hypothetical protein
MKSQEVPNAIIPSKNATSLPPGRRPHGPEAERSNSTMKENLKILVKPKVLKGSRANNILASSRTNFKDIV